MAQTRAVFNDCGNKPSWRDLLTIIEIGIESCWENSLSRCVGMLKGPHALFAPKLDMISEISLASHGFSTRLDGFWAPR